MSHVATAERHTDDSQRPSGGISPRVVLNAVWRHPFAFIGVVLLALLAGLGIWFFLPLPKKTAAVVFQVSSQPTVFASGPSTPADFATYKQSQMTLIKSRRTFNTLLNSEVEGFPIKNLQILQTAEPDAVTWLDKHVMVESKTGTEHIRVTIEGDSDHELQKLLSALKDAYLGLARERDNGVRISRLKDLQDRHKVLDDQVKEANKGIESHRNLVGLDDGAFQFLNELFRQEEYKKALVTHQQHSNTERALMEDLEAAKKYLHAWRKAAHRTAVLSVAGGPVAIGQSGEEAPLADRVPSAAVTSELKKDATLQQKEADVASARETVARVRELAPGALTKALDQLKTAEEKRDQFEAEVRPLIEARLKEAKLLGAELHVEKMQRELEQAILDKARAWTQIKEVESKLVKIKDAKEAIRKLKDGIAEKEPLAKQLASEIERLKLELGAPARVTVAEDPYVFQGLEGNRRLKYALMAGLGALVLGFGGLVMWEHRSRRVTRTEEVSTDLGARLIGTIPPLVAEVGGVASSHDVNSALVEAIDTTRIMLTHAGADGSNLRVLMVTSAVSGEGKTTLSGNLAISLTRAGFRTLLIDGDMQAPSAHLLFGIPDAPGLSELLRGEIDLASTVRPSPIPGLSILPAGRWNMSTRQSLVGDRWRTLKKQLETEFDFVVIDTSPLLMVSDAMLLAREADGVVLSVLLGVSQIARVAETVNRLHAIGAELAGVVVNNVQSQVYRRYMSRAKYASPPPVAPDQEEMAFAEEAVSGNTEAMAEEIGAESAGNIGER